MTENISWTVAIAGMIIFWLLFLYVRAAQRLAQVEIEIIERAAMKTEVYDRLNPNTSLADLTVGALNGLDEALEVIRDVRARG